MNFLDMRTVVFSYAISNFICMIVIAVLWKQNRRRFAGLGFWLADFILQFAALVLVPLRGMVPDLLSMTVSNSIVIGGTILLYIGLVHFTGERIRQVHNYILLIVFILVHAYFVIVFPSLIVRNILISLALLAICSQCAWFLLQRVKPEMRPITRGVGNALAGFCLVSMVRLVVELAVPAGNDFFHSNIYETLLFVTYQMLFVILTLSLVMMVNQRLFISLEEDIAARGQAESALRLSEEKFFKAFHASPDAITITRLSDGKLVEVNEGFSRLSEYSREEALASSTQNLNLWADPQDREICVTALQENHRIHDYEFDFRTKSGKILNGLYSGEIIRLGDEVHVLSIIRDITKRKQAEGALHKSEERLKALIDNLPIGLSVLDQDREITYSNPALEHMLEMTKTELLKGGYQGRTYVRPDGTPMPPEEFASMRAFREQRPVHNVEIGVVAESGRTIWTSVSAAPFPTTDQGVVIATVDITERRRAEEALLKLAAYEERQRLARNLHDSVNQSLHSLVLFAETLTSMLEKKHVDRAREVAERLQESARQALKEMRLMLYQLQPPGPGGTVNLVRDIEARLASVERRAGVQAQVIVEGSLENLPPEWHENLFYITIESLNNALKHAGAHKVKITIRCRPPWLELEIANNGKGFEPARTQTGGYGLHSMRERAGLLGGELNILSNPGEGTCVRFRAEIKE
jgi:PAS domain S-box-containing protein